MRIHIPLRFRILGLLTGALALSLGADLWIGKQLLVQDKTAYLFDIGVTHSNRASQAIQTELNRLKTLAELIALGGSPLTSGAELSAQGAKISKALKFSSLKITKSKRGQKDWNNHDLTRVESDGKGHLRVSYALLVDPDTQVKFETEVESADFAPATGSGFQTQVFNLDDSLSSAPPSDGQIVISPELKNNLFKSEFASGVRDTKIDGADYLVGYEKIESGKILVMSLVPKAEISKPVQTLVQRSVTLNLGVFLICISLTLLLMRGLTRKLAQLVRATIRVGRGDFQINLNEKKSHRFIQVVDELSSLSSSFSLMSGKISELMEQTAKKVRMEDELKTAQTVQSKFFPSAPFQSDEFSISGQSMPASECGGDWWQYAVIEDTLFFILGDVTGHGVSAALVTASVHSAFMIWKRLWSVSDQVNDPKFASLALKHLVAELNSTIISMGGEQVNLSCLVAAVELKTRKLHLANAGHPPPYLFKSVGGSVTFKPLMSSSSLDPLGQKNLPEASPDVFELEPDDYLFFYTDGLFDARQSDGKKLKKKDFLTSIIEETHNQKTPSELCESSLGQAQKFFTGAIEERPDDITVVFIQFSGQASKKAVSVTQSKTQRRVA